MMTSSKNFILSPQNEMTCNTLPNCKLTNTQLIARLHDKTMQERNLTLEIIGLLEEVDRRSLHLEMGYGSLLEFCIKELKYSESSAYRRISAMRVTKEIPQVKDSIKQGILNLVTISQANTFFRQEKKYKAKIFSKNEKLLLLKSLENKSKREAEKILLEKSPDLPKQEIVKQISENQTRISLTLDESLIKQLDLLKSKYSHKNPNPSYAELIQFMASELLNKIRNADIKQSEIKQNETKIAQRTPTPPVRKFELLKETRKSRHITSAIRRFVFNRDHHGCSFINKKTNQKCNSRFQLELDHIIPFSQGGENKIENLRLVCRNHNQYYWKFVQMGKMHL